MTPHVDAAQSTGAAALSTSALEAAAFAEVPDSARGGAGSVPSWLQSTTPASAAAPATAPLSLQDALRSALLNNSALSVSRLGPQLGEAELQSARGRFDAKSRLDLNHHDNRISTSTSLDGANVLATERSRLGGDLFQQLFHDGTVASVQLDLDRLESNSRFRVLNPSYVGLLKVAARRPLYRGGGDANMAEVDLARTQLERARWSLSHDVIQLLLRTEKAYWELVFLCEDVAIRRRSLEQAQVLLQASRERYKSGAVPLTEVLQSRAGVATRVEAVVNAEVALVEADARMRRLLGMPIAASASPLLLVDRPDLRQPLPNASSAVASALVMRPDYRMALVDLDARRIRVARAKNEKLPRVDVLASYGLNGLGGSLGRSLEGIRDTDFPGWEVGVAVELPWQDTTANGEHRRRELEVQAALLGIKDLGQRIELEAQLAARQISAAATRLRVARVADEAARDGLAGEEEQFEQGLIASYQLLIFQEQLAEARRKAARAEADYGSSLAEFEAATGQSLVAKGVLVAASEPASPGAK